MVFAKPPLHSILVKSIQDSYDVAVTEDEPLHSILVKSILTDLQGK